MKKITFLILAIVAMVSCGKKTSSVASDADSTVVSEVPDTLNNVEAVDTEAKRSFVEQFYQEWDKRSILDYDYLKPHITPNLLKYLADAYDFDCEGECLATWKFFYEGGGDVSELESRQITARDENHILVRNKYVNYEYDVLLKVIKVGDSFKIDSLKQERSEYIELAI